MTSSFAKPPRSVDGRPRMLGLLDRRSANGCSFLALCYHTVGLLGGKPSRPLFYHETNAARPTPRPTAKQFIRFLAHRSGTGTFTPLSRAVIEMHLFLIILRFIFGSGNRCTNRFHAIAVRTDGTTYGRPLTHRDVCSNVAGWLGFSPTLTPKHMRSSWVPTNRDNWLQILGKRVRSTCSGFFTRFRCAMIARD